MRFRTKQSAEQQQLLYIKNCSRTVNLKLSESEKSVYSLLKILSTHSSNKSVTFGPDTVISVFKTMYVIGKSTAIILFLVVAAVFVVLTVLEQQSQIEPEVSGGTSLDKEAAHGDSVKLRKSSGSTQHFRGRRRSLLDSAHPSPHHSGVHFMHNASIHKKVWMHYEVVDGLKNEEVVMFVMSSTVKDGYLLRERFVNYHVTSFKL